MYKLTINGRKPFDAEKESYNEGDEVVIRIPVMTDCSIRVYSSDADVGRSEYLDGALVYRFVMPANDVDVKTEVTNNMMNKAPSFMMAAAPDMMAAANSVSFYCPECGRKAGSTDKFCTECGTKLIK